MSSDQLAIAIALTRSGEKEAARELLSRIVKEEPQNEMAWMWLVDTMPGDAERIATLEECLKALPDSLRARHALTIFRARQPAPPPQPIPPQPVTNRQPESANTAQASPAAVTGESAPEKEVSQAAPVAEPVPAPVEPAEASAEALPPKKPRTPKPRRKKRGFFRTCVIVVLTIVVLAGTGAAIWLGAAYMQENSSLKIASDQATAAVLETQIKAQETAAPTTSLSQLKAQTQTAQPQVLLPSNQAGPAVLPFPLYFISDKSGSDQVWRMEYDGKTLTRVTNEDAPVTGLDVSSVDGALAYVSGNQLIVADASGNGRRVLLSGEDLASTSPNDNKSNQISDPLWSPDGSRLAYRLNGVNIVKPPDDRPISLVVDGPLPEETSTSTSTPTATSTVTATSAVPGTNTDTGVNTDNTNDTNEDTPLGPLTYRPVIWSPDGTHVVTQVTGQAYQALAVFSAVGGKSIDLEGFNSCCDMTWSLDSKYLYLANAKIMSTDPALMKIDTKTGEVTAIIPNQEADKYYYIRWPVMASSGQLYFFEGFESDTASQPLLLSSAAGAKMENIIQVYKSGSYDLVDSLWSPDVSVAIVQDASQPGLQLLYSDGRPPITLDASGHNLRWGSQAMSVNPVPLTTPEVVAETVQEALKKKYIGLQYPPQPDEIETIESPRIASDPSDYGLTITRADNQMMLWLEKFLSKEPAGINHLEVMDVIVVPALAGETVWDFTGCSLNGTADPDILALGYRQDPNAPVKLFAAWRVNPTDFKFVQLYTSAVQCTFEKTE